jgi:dephospho-CoA kinase
VSTILPNIAFIGRAGAGKTTARAYLEEAYGYEHLSFAAPLKVMAGTTDDRGLLQQLGLAVRDVVEDGWVNLLLDEMSCHAGVKWAVDDCRFPNEAAALRGEGFIIVRIDALRSIRVDRLKRSGRLQDDAQLEHASETALDGYRGDYRYANNSPWPGDLHHFLDDVVNRERS